MTIKPKVSICCITYNHENYIKQTLDGFMMQETNFPFEILIHDDASTDRTADIIREYEARYPDIIKPIYQTENQFAKGISPATRFNYTRLQSNYVAICEGDDYWTDKTKLQKQADFLDKNPDFSLCFHPVTVKFEDGSAPDFLYPSPEMNFTPDSLQLKYLFTTNFIQTNSVMYRWRFKTEEELIRLFPNEIVPADWFLHLLHAQVGKIGFIDEVMAVYRRHAGGIWWASQSNPEQLHLCFGVKELMFYLELEKTFPEYIALSGHELTKRVALSMFNIYLKNQRFIEMQEILTLCPDCIAAKARSL